MSVIKDIKSLIKNSISIQEQVLLTFLVAESQEETESFDHPPLLRVN